MTTLRTSANEAKSERKKEKEKSYQFHRLVTVTFYCWPVDFDFTDNLVYAWHIMYLTQGCVRLASDLHDRSKLVIEDRKP